MLADTHCQAFLVSNKTGEPAKELNSSGIKYFKQF